MLDEEPAIPDHLAEVWRAFGVLNASRTGSGSGPNPLAISEILTLSTFVGLDPERSLVLLQGMDRVFLDEWAQKRKREIDAAKAK